MPTSAANPKLEARTDSTESIALYPSFYGSQVFVSIMVTAFLAIVYLANGRHIGSGDCVPATYLPIALARGDGPWLDRFRPILQSPEGQLPGYCELSRGHVVSRYPMGPGLVIAPLVIPQVLVWDQLQPGWSDRTETFQPMARRMAKNASALVSAISMGLLWFWLANRFNNSAAMVATLAVGLGSDLWSVGSQAAWQHGPAVFCLMVALICLEFFAEKHWAAIVSGFFAAMIVVCRPVDLPITLTLWLYSLTLGRPFRRRFTLAAGVVALLWSCWNVWFFDHMTGGYSEIEKMHGWAHGVQGSWSTPLLQGLAGTLVSPSHGLLIYCPWVVFALTGGACFWRKMQSKQIQLPFFLMLSLPATLVILSKYSCWWGGHCFGPRFWVDSSPILGMMLAASWTELQFKVKKQSRMLQFLILISILWSISIQVVAVMTYPTSWHSTPTNADKDHKRLWDWHDQEVIRGLHEGVKSREWNGFF